MPDTGHPVSRIRNRVILFAVALAIITYMQRVVISQAAPSIQEDLGLTRIQMGLVFSAFSWMYSIFEIPGGFAADRWGARRVLPGIVSAWSLFTAATGWCWNLVSLVLARGLFGMFQAGCFPTITRMFINWLPVSERVRAQGIVWLSARWGGAFTPLIVVLLLDHLSWRWAFGCFGLVGFVWAAFFFWWFQDDPKQHPGIGQVELDELPKFEGTTLGQEKIPWKLLLRSRTVWLLWGQYMCLNFGWQFYITWLPTYLLEARNVDLHRTAFLAGLPLFFGGLGCLGCGYISSFLDRWTGNTRTTRRLLAGTGFAGAAFCFALSVHIEDPTWAMVALGVASFSNDLVMPPSWGACMDVGGKLCGTLAGSMNMMGGLIAALAPTVVALILVWTNENWAITFYVSSAIYFMGTFFWLLLDPVTPIAQGDGR